jgi:hypothetical protein
VTPALTPHVRWQGQGEATIVSIAKDAIVLRSTVSSPPGSRLEGTLAGEPPGAVRVKIHGCRRQPEGDFMLEGRLLDVTRGVRAAIAARVAPRSP